MAPDDDSLIGGRERRRIDICPYDEAWPERYRREQVRIVAALGDRAARVEHIGSTSVPGLAAKPIIDILIEVRGIFAAARFREPLEAAGYELRVREPHHLMFRTPEHDVHIHLWSLESDVRRHLVFRDWLRINADDRRLYEETKLGLQGWWDDTNDYADAKSEVIEAILHRARS